MSEIGTQILTCSEIQTKTQPLFIVTMTKTKMKQMKQIETDEADEEYLPIGNDVKLEYDEHVYM